MGLTTLNYKCWWSVVGLHIKMLKQEEVTDSDHRLGFLFKDGMDLYCTMSHHPRPDHLFYLPMIPRRRPQDLLQSLSSPLFSVAFRTDDHIKINVKPSMTSEIFRHLRVPQSTYLNHLIIGSCLQYSINPSYWSSYVQYNIFVILGGGVFWGCALIFKESAVDESIRGEYCKTVRSRRRGHTLLTFITAPYHADGRGGLMDWITDYHLAKAMMMKTTPL